MRGAKVLSSIIENALLWIASEEKNIMVAYNNFQGSGGGTSIGRAQGPYSRPQRAALGLKAGHGPRCLSS